MEADHQVETPLEYVINQDDQVYQDTLPHLKQFKITLVLKWTVCHSEAVDREDDMVLLHSYGNTNYFLNA